LDKVAEHPEAPALRKSGKMNYQRVCVHCAGVSWCFNTYSQNVQQLNTALKRAEEIKSILRVKFEDEADEFAKEHERRIIEVTYPMYLHIYLLTDLPTYTYLPSTYLNTYLPN